MVTLRNVKIFKIDRKAFKQPRKKPSRIHQRQNEGTFSTLHVHELNKFLLRIKQPITVPNTVRDGFLRQVFKKKTSTGSADVSHNSPTEQVGLAYYQTIPTTKITRQPYKKWKNPFFVLCCYLLNAEKGKPHSTQKHKGFPRKDFLAPRNLLSRKPADSGCIIQSTQKLLPPQILSCAFKDLWWE